VSEQTAEPQSPAESDGGEGRGEAGAEEALDVAGRLGLAGRTGFYAVLAGIVAEIAVLGGPAGHQADSQGALQIVCRSLPGQVAVAAAALGFVLLGAGRLVGAWRDAGSGTWRRVMTGAQGVFYLGLTYVPASYLAGDHQSGSERSQQQTAGRLLSLPAGREMVAGLGVVLVAVCVHQVRGALRRDFTDGLDLAGAPRFVRRITGLAGSVGIAARAVVFLPVGVFFVVAAVQADPGHADGLDAELLALSGSTWGDVALAAVAAGLAVFVVYSAIETRYRQVVCAR
jgi:hypothetical protein